VTGRGKRPRSRLSRSLDTSPNGWKKCLIFRRRICLDRRPQISGCTIRSPFPWCKINFRRESRIGPTVRGWWHGGKAILRGSFGQLQFSNFFPWRTAVVFVMLLNLSFSLLAGGQGREAGCPHRWTPHAPVCLLLSLSISLSLSLSHIDTHRHRHTQTHIQANTQTHTHTHTQAPVCLCVCVCV